MPGSPLQRAGGRPPRPPRTAGRAAVSSTDSRSRKHSWRWCAHSVLHTIPRCGRGTRGPARAIPRRLPAAAGPAIAPDPRASAASLAARPPQSGARPFRLPAVPRARNWRGPTASARRHYRERSGRGARVPVGEAPRRLPLAWRGPAPSPTHRGSASECFDVAASHSACSSVVVRPRKYNARSSRCSVRAPMRPARSRQRRLHESAKTPRSHSTEVVPVSARSSGSKPSAAMAHSASTSQPAG